MIEQLHLLFKDRKGNGGTSHGRPRLSIRALWCAIVAILLASTTALCETKHFDHDAWIEDYSFLKHALEKQYSNLAWFGSVEGKVDLPSLDRSTTYTLQHAKTDEEAENVLLSFVERFHDGHFSQLPSYATKGIPAKDPSEPALLREDPIAGCATLGYSIDASTEFSVSFESLSGFELLTDGVRKPYRSGVFKSTDGTRVGVIRIPSFRTTRYSAFCLEAWTATDVWTADGKLDQDRLSEEIEEAWYRELSQTLKGLAAKQVNAVLVDVGNNSGGDDSGDEATRLFSSMPIRSSSLFMTQNAATSLSYFDEQLEALRQALTLTPHGETVATLNKNIMEFATNKASLDKHACSLNWVWTVRKHWTSEACRRLVPAGSSGGPLAYLSPSTTDSVKVDQQLNWAYAQNQWWSSWTGPLYILANGKTHSAAEMFTAILQNNHAAKVIGMRTGGDGCGFMNTPDPVVLPHSHLRFRIPNCVRLRADGTDEVAGIQPDLPLSPLQGESARSVALRMMMILIADLGGYRFESH